MIFLVFLLISELYIIGGSNDDGGESFAFDRIKDEIKNYTNIANAIIKLSLYGKAQNQSYDRLATFVDKFGSRISGSDNLEHAIDYMMDALKNDGLDNVHGEPVEVPHWVRGNESAIMLSPRLHRMSILGLGSSIGTPPGGVTGEVIVVKSFKELHARASEAKGKIVVYNEDFVDYGTTVAYRENGAVEAAKVGAVASLIRSVTDFSIYSPHTGLQDYAAGVPKIPTACITVEDAEMMHRMSKRGNKIIVRLTMDAKTMNRSAISRNTVAEIKGRTHPEQVVLVSGHLDSWDVGQGAMDDGGGAFISWQALSLIRQLNLRPKRTLRVVLWTGEEQGHVGGKSYWSKHSDDVRNYDLVMESDGGTFTPRGLQFSGNKAATAVMAEVLKLLAPINASSLVSPADSGDVAGFMAAGVPGGSLYNENEKYFYFHHTDADTMTVQDPVAMNMVSALWSVVAYVVADLDDMLPRHTRTKFNVH
ncbi:carboxypeptidase Q-like [Gigantopelta aegis]|uniref:carboxypeptidase Q-like n=1 Tax=Gigantopelta aegis TaxID=1735272 RepID=UPI001B88E17A|nr:carboxypeptidase Q-like [Gigantopelta aegis]